MGNQKKQTKNIENGNKNILVRRHEENGKNVKFEIITLNTEKLKTSKDGH